MCKCIENIKTSYSRVKRETSRLSRRSFCDPILDVGITQVNMDDFLDAINSQTHELHQLTQVINDLIDGVRSAFCDISTQEAEELLELSGPMYDKMQLVQRKLHKSPLYVGMQTVVDIYEDAMSDFEELCHDLRTWRIDLEQDEEFEKLREQLKGIA